MRGPPGPPGPAGKDGSVAIKYYHADWGQAPEPVGETPRPCPWTYAGAAGPWAWGRICKKEYAACGIGKSQSPIDIAMNALEWDGSLKPEQQQTLGWHIPPTAATDFVYYVKGRLGGNTAEESFDGHTFQVEHISATLEYDNVVYELKQFHMHTYSEHTFDGAHSDLEIQFVHTTRDHTAFNKELIIAVFFKVVAGQGSPTFLRQLIQSIPKLSDVPSKLVPLDFAEIAQTVMIGSIPHRGPSDRDFSPNFRNYLSYQGSFTTPPCKQGVQWILLRNPVFIYGEDARDLHRLMGNNFRPAQPLNGRTVWATEP